MITTSIDILVYSACSFSIGFLVGIKFYEKKNSKQGLLNTLKRYHDKFLDIYSNIVFSKNYSEETISIMQDIYIVINEMNKKIYLNLSDIKNFKDYIQEDLPNIVIKLNGCQDEESETKRMRILLDIKLKVEYIQKYL